MVEKVKIQCSRCGVDLLLSDHDHGDGEVQGHVSGPPLCGMCLLEDGSCGCSDPAPDTGLSGADAPGANAPGDDE